VVSLSQVVPESEDVQMSAPMPCADAATRCVPAASDATETHNWPDAAVPVVRFVQVAPESADTQMSPA
jgi:hypothetical protein